MELATFLGTYLVLIVVASALLALIPAFIAREKGRSFGAFWALGFFATVIVGLIAVIAIPPVERQRSQYRPDDPTKQLELPDEAKCPSCAEFIKFEARVCRFCGNDVSNEFAQIAKDIDAARTLKAKSEELRLAMEVDEAEQRRIAEQRAAELSRARLIRILRAPLTWIAVVAVLAGIVGAGVWVNAATNAVGESKAATISSLADRCAGTLGQGGDYWTWTGRINNAAEKFSCIQSAMASNGVDGFSFAGIRLEESDQKNVVRFSKAQFNAEVELNGFGPRGQVVVYLHYRSSNLIDD